MVHQGQGNSQGHGNSQGQGNSQVSLVHQNQDS